MRKPPTLRPLTNAASKTGAAIRRATMGAADCAIDASIALNKGSRPRATKRIRWPRGTADRLSRLQNGLCVYCRCRLTADNRHIDHIIPVARGGPNEERNYQLLCGPCNMRKAEQSDAEFRSRYRALLPPRQGAMPERPIPQSAFRAETKRTRPAQSVRNFRRGRYLSNSQRINGGCIAIASILTVGGCTIGNRIFQPDDMSFVFAAPLVLSSIIAVGIRIRARVTGKDQEPE